MTVRRALLLSLLISAAPLAALAASHDRATFILEEDLNKDGKVDKDEYAQSRAAQFKLVDADHDGRLSHDEYVGEFRARLEAGKVGGKAPAAKERRKQLDQAEVRFGVLDTNADGAISAAEFDYSGWAMFIHHDADKDGVVSKLEPVKK